jgi:hypothetical protein
MITRIGYICLYSKPPIRIAVLPAMLSGSQIWWNKTPSVLDSLNKAYNKMARWITGLPITTKTEGLLTCAHLPSLDAYLNYLTATYAVRQSFLLIDHTINTIPRIQDNSDRLTLSRLPTILNSIRSIPGGRLEDQSN